MTAPTDGGPVADPTAWLLTPAEWAVLAAGGQDEPLDETGLSLVARGLLHPRGHAVLPRVEDALVALSRPELLADVQRTVDGLTVRVALALHGDVAVRTDALLPDDPLAHGQEGLLLLRLLEGPAGLRDELLAVTGLDDLDVGQHASEDAVAVGLLCPGTGAVDGLRWTVDARGVLDGTDTGPGAAPAARTREDLRRRLLERLDAAWPGARA